ncbi:MAG TPA: hypothetical protein EYO33_28590, partial [Phycisphaerales bacterium]|nr:hypothetical protein [Phycisphaerales bacterium]
MADEEKNVESTESGGKKGGGLKTIVIVAVMMLGEAGALFFLINMMNGPSAADASQLQGLEDSG